MLTSTVVNLDFTDTAELTVKKALCSANGMTYSSFTQLGIDFVCKSQLDYSGIKCIARSKVISLGQMKDNQTLVK